MPPAPRPAGESAADALVERAGRLEQIHESAQDKDWRGLHHLVEGEAGVRGLPAELRQGLEGLRTPARKLAVLAGCRAALERPGAGLPTGLDELPEPLQRDFRELHALDDLGPALGKPWPKPPDVPAIQRDLAAVGAADGKLALRLKLHLALKAEVEGHGEAARKLLPSPKELESASPELRDLKAAAGPLGDAGSGKQGPPPAEPLLPPEPPLAGTRPGIKESLQKDLPGLTNEVNGKKARVRTRVREGIEKQSDLYAASLGHPLHTVLDYARKEREKQEADRTAAVSKQLARPLTASERILVRVMGRKGKTPAEMAAILSQLSPAPKR